MSLAFTLAAGWTGFASYRVVIGVGFGVRLMTYLQHWGLGVNSVADTESRQYAWENGGRFQAWLTLHISFHQAHHHANRTPLYRLGMSDLAPRLPAGYVILMVLCLFPRLWQSLMLPALDHWRSQPHARIAPGRRLSCFNLYGRGVVEAISR